MKSRIQKILSKSPKKEQTPIDNDDTGLPSTSDPKGNSSAAGTSAPGTIGSPAERRDRSSSDADRPAKAEPRPPLSSLRRHRHLHPPDDPADLRPTGTAIGAGAQMRADVGDRRRRAGLDRPGNLVDADRKTRADGRAGIESILAATPRQHP